MIKLENVGKTYTKSKGVDHVAIDNITIELPSSGMVTIIGRSGSGKTTLLKLMSGLLRPTVGSIYYKDSDLNKLSKNEMDNLRENDFGFIFQDFNLIDNLTVIQNMNIVSQNPSSDKILNILSELSLSEKNDSLVKELSTGEKQRVSIVRTLAKGVNVIYADEPTGSLDEENAKIVLDRLKELSRHILVILVTHNKEDALTYADRIIKIENGNIKEDIKNKNDLETNEIILSKEVCENDNKSLPKTIPYNRKILNKRKIRSIFSWIFWYISFSIFLLSINFISTNKNDFAARILKKNNDTEFKVTERDHYITSENIKTINTDGLLKYDVSLSEYYYTNNFKVHKISGFNHEYNPQLEQFFENSLFDYIVIKDTINIDNSKIEIGDGEIVISDFLAEKLMYYKIFDRTKLTEIVGKNINYDNKITLKIKQIFPTDYLYYYKLLENNDNFNMSDRNFASKRSNDYSTIYMNSKTFDELNKSIINSFNVNINNTNAKIADESEINNNVGSGYMGDFPRDSDEAIVSISFLSVILGEELTESNPNDLEKYLNKLYKIELEKDGKLLTHEFYLSGVIYATDIMISLPKDIYNDFYSTFNDIVYDNTIFKQGTYIIMNSYNQNSKIIKYLLNNNSFYYTNYSHDVLYGVELIESQTKIFLILFFGTFIFTLLSIYFFTTTLVNDNIKEIGILRSLGYSERKISFILMKQNFKIFIYAITISIVTLILINNDLNKLITQYTSLDLILFKINIFTLLLSVIALLGIVLFFSILPIIKITKKELAYVIYN